VQAQRWRSFDESVFSRITRDAHAHGAVNLAQGFPNFPGPHRLLECVSEQVLRCPNQYAPTQGFEPCLRALDRFVSTTYALDWGARNPPLGAITAGATEAIFCLIMGLVDPGDRVLCFEPYYESYRQAVAAAGGEFVPVRLVAPSAEESGDEWQIDWNEFHAAVSLPFKCLILNTPHNPTGMVLSYGDLETILEACRRRGAALLSDEVYEQLYFDEPPASILQVVDPNDAYVRVSSAAKSFGFTGFKVGWMHGERSLVQAAMRVHEAVMFCTPAAIQLGLAAYLQDLEQVQETLHEQRATYQRRRDLMVKGLEGLGFVIGQAPQGSYFVTASAYGLGAPGESDVSFAQRMLREALVAALPVSALCAQTSRVSVRIQREWSQLRWLRFAFCKSDEVIELALQNLSKWRSCVRLESEA
jgi:aspartate/methionine/tyrosine aminotransferase